MSAAEKKPRRGYRHVENRRLMAAVYTILRLSVLAVLVAQFFNRNFENVLLSRFSTALFTTVEEKISDTSSPEPSGAFPSEA